MKFKEFLQEQKEKHAVMAFGRMNPITVGHEKLVDKVQDIAKEVGGTSHIVVSHSQDPKKNPLTAAQKVRHAKKAFPSVNVTSSDKESPNFLSQASKLHQKGVTHLHMVGGSDRAAEYEHLLNKYNGVHGPHGFFKFKGITVHSAGDRDPDAEGVEGMSASKMREHATKGNFKEFRKGVPSKMTDAHAKLMYNDVRKGMGLNEDVNLDFVEVLVEGVHDQSIFKAVFLAGGPGSGKDYVLDNTLQGQGLTEINSDKALEFLMDKEGLDKKMPESEKEIREYVRTKAKNMTELRQRLALKGRNGLIINGTGDNAEKVARIKSALEEMGYDTSMVLVNTDDDISAERNIDRGRRGGRAVPETIRKQKWDAVQNARTEYAKMFGDRYMEFDNSQDLREAPPEVVRDKKIEMLQIYKNVKEFVSTPPQSEEASLWVAHELDVSDTANVDPNTQTVNPHPSSGAAEEAAKLGLQYYGFGRYGKNGAVTHRSVHDKLVEIKREEPQQKEMPIPGTSMHQLGDQTIHVKLNKKNINEEFDDEFEEEFLNESVSFTVTADTNEEMKEFLSNLKFEKDEVEVDEEYQPKDLLSLGKTQQAFGVSMENTTITNQMVSQIMYENEDNYLKDAKGRVRIFMLRAAAAREAHQKDGKVVKFKHGYAILIKEETDNVSNVEEIFEDSKTGTRDTTGSTVQSGTTGSNSSGRKVLAEESCGCETTKKTTSKKITIAEIRNRKKKIESCGCDEGKEVK